MSWCNRVVFAALAGAILCTGSLARAAPMRVAVLDFENSSADRSLDSLGKGLQSMFMTDLAQVSALQIVERARLADVQRELKLGRSRGFDPKTAARVGKLAGASHLVTGTFTIAGKKMRMDCRLFAVDSGAVLLSEKAEGEADGFFEVQKGLVKRVLEAVSVRLEPKERAALMRVQTADLGALTAFSKGLALGDDRRYEDALEAIKEARRRDPDFKLAETTQAEYERLVAELRTEAVAINLRDKAAARSKTREATKIESAALEQLYAYAGRKGDTAREERLAALGALAGWLSAARPSPSAPPAISDGFTKNCMADAYTQRYLGEALRLYPKVPLVPKRPDEGLVLYKDEFAPEFQKILQRRRAPTRRDLLPTADELDPVLDRLRLLPPDRADLHQRLYKVMAALGPEPDWKVAHLMEIGYTWRQATAFDRSTDLFKQAADASTGTQRAHTLTKVADEIELNKTLSAALKKASTPVDREVVHWAVGRRQYEESSLSEGKRRPHDMRAFPITQTQDGAQYHGPLLLGKHPVWQFGFYEHALTSGPRRDGVKISELRYFWDSRTPPWSENIAVLDCSPRKDFAMRFTASFSPPADFKPSKVPAPSAEAVAAGIDPRRPVVGVVFGIARPVCCETEGYAVLVAPDAVKLVRVHGNPPELKAPERYAKKVLEEQKVDLGGGEIEVSIEVSGASIQIRAGGKSLTLRAPEEREGYTGLYFGGHGFAGVSDVSLSRS
jgi:TolB-like protein